MQDHFDITLADVDRGNHLEGFDFDEFLNGDSFDFDHPRGTPGSPSQSTNSPTYSQINEADPKADQDPNDHMVSR